MSRHGQHGPDVRLKIGAVALGFVLACAALVGFGVALISGFLSTSPKPSALRSHAHGVESIAAWNGPLPTGMVGLVTIGAGPPGGSTHGTSVRTSSATTSAARASDPASAPVFAIGAPGATVAAAPPTASSTAPHETASSSAASKSHRPTSSAPSSPGWAWPSPSSTWWN